jgi:hypothetical protein
MFAGGGVETGVGDPEALDGLVSDNVGLDDFCDISQSHVAVPHGFGIDHDGGTVLALVEASGLVGTDCCLNASERKQALEFAMQVSAGGGVTATARMAFSALIAADEDVLFELWHGGLQNRE